MLAKDSNSPPQVNRQLKRVPLHNLHVEHGGKLVPFAGYEMPVQYVPGVLKEHLHTRKSAGLFDVSHMGQIVLRPRSGDVKDAATALEQLVPQDILSISRGRQRYALFTNDNGGILDDLMVANLGDHLLLVVNAAYKYHDEAYLREHLSDTCFIEPLVDRALIAQGPKAVSVLAQIAPNVATMRFMDSATQDILNVPCFVSRSGYTGEDGYEISILEDAAEHLVTTLLKHSDVSLVGLGVRDSLRLEAGLCLYGNDINNSTTPIEGSLEWAIQKCRRNAGIRAGGFPGAEVILTQLESGARRRRVGLRAEGRLPIREHAPLYADNSSIDQIGVVTSGGFGPSAGGPVAMGYVPTPFAIPDTKVFSEVRGQRISLRVTTLPFVSPTYQR